MLTETIQAESYIERFYAVSTSQDTTGRITLSDWNNIVSMSNIIGLSTTQTYAGLDATVCIMGIVTNPNWDWIPYKPVYVYASGTLTQTRPAKNVYKIGTAMSKTKLFVKPSEFIMVKS